jgi:isoleucyl-tRNA synthetase
VAKGFVYRGKKPVYWSIPCRTALAEAEVEYHDHVSQSVFVKFPVVGQPKTFIVIWTTTPWTLPANLAVAYNEKLQYVQVKVGEENFILFRGLLPLSRKMRLDEFYRNAFPDRTTLEAAIPTSVLQSHRQTFAADFVTSDTGTGFVHIAPGHGLDDYNLGRQNGLPIYSPVDDDGKLAYTNDCRLSSKCPPRWSANPFWKNTARATPTKPCCTNSASATRCCTRKIIITAIRIAGAARRRSSSARWTSGSSRLTNPTNDLHSFPDSL